MTVGLWLHKKDNFEKHVLYDTLSPDLRKWVSNNSDADDCSPYCLLSYFRDVGLLGFRWVCMKGSCNLQMYFLDVCCYRTWVLTHYKFTTSPACLILWDERCACLGLLHLFTLGYMRPYSDWRIHQQRQLKMLEINKYSCFPYIENMFGDMQRIFDL